MYEKNPQEKPFLHTNANSKALVTFYILFEDEVVDMKRYYSHIYRELKLGQEKYDFAEKSSSHTTTIVFLFYHIFEMLLPKSSLNSI